MMSEEKKHEEKPKVMRICKIMNNQQAQRVKKWVRPRAKAMNKNRID